MSEITKQHLDWFSHFCMAHPFTQTCKILCFTAVFKTGQPPKLPRPIADLDNIYHIARWTHQSQPRQIASGSVQPFLQGLQTRPTDRHTDRPRYSICSNRPHLMMPCGLNGFYNNDIHNKHVAVQTINLIMYSKTGCY